MIDFNKIKLFLFDLDGTLYLGDAPIGGVSETLNILREKNVRVGYLTNNSSKTDAEYLSKLKKLAIYNQSDFFYSSLDSAVDYLRETNKNACVYAVATKSVSEHLKDAGVRIVEENDFKNADTVLMTFDRELNYKKIERANYLIKKGAKYIATHPDLVCPAPEVFVPDLGSFIKMFEASSGRLPDVIVGKPYKLMGENIEKRLNLRSDEICMVGDRLNTDIAFGLNCGFKSVLVLSGESTEKDIQRLKIYPDAVLTSVNELVKEI